MEILDTSMKEFEYIKALVETTNNINETITKEEHDIYEDNSSVTLMKEIRRNSLQKAAMSLCKRVCEAQDMTFEETIEKIKSLYLEEDEFPEAKGLIQVIKHSCLNGTSIVSLVMAEDFNAHSLETFTIPTDQAEVCERKVN